MKKFKDMVVSSNVDHTRLNKGLHLLEKLEYPFDVTFYSYDLRFKKPILLAKDSRKVLSSATIHTIEHFLAYYLRYFSKSDLDIVSVFPYGCKTGFGVVSTLTPLRFRNLLLKTVDYIVDNPLSIPFDLPETCGNCYLNNLKGAKIALRKFSQILFEQSLESICKVPKLR